MFSQARPKFQQHDQCVTMIKLNICSAGTTVTLKSQMLRFRLRARAFCRCTCVYGAAILQYKYGLHCPKLISLRVQCFAICLTLHTDNTSDFFEDIICRVWRAWRSHGEGRLDSR
jgi:hypothetical protein